MNMVMFFATLKKIHAIEVEKEKGEKEEAADEQA